MQRYPTSKGALPRECRRMLHLLRVPKWGLSMERAKVLVWLQEEGSAVEIGTGLVEGR